MDVVCFGNIMPGMCVDTPIATYHMYSFMTQGPMDMAYYSSLLLYFIVMAHTKKTTWFTLHTNTKTNITSKNKFVFRFYADTDPE